MEEDRDAESQTSSSHSSSWWMMKNLWRKGASDERRFQASIADTCLLEDGHPLYWYFTSSKSGRILKVQANPSFGPEESYNDTNRLQNSSQHFVPFNDG